MGQTYRIKADRTSQKVVHELILDPFGDVLVAEIKNQIFGCVQLKCPDYAGGLVIDPQWHQQGIGKRLMIACELHAKDNMNMERLSGSVLLTKPTLFNYYKELGYERTGIQVKHPVWHGEMVELIQKNLIPTSKL